MKRKYTLRRIEDLFFKYVTTTWDGCWEWIGSKNPKGYGCFRVRGTLKPAHRVAYDLFVGIIPEGLRVLHKCDNRACVNPKHLWLGTNQDNTNDMISKGRDNLRTQQKYFTREEKLAAHREVGKRYRDRINPNRQIKQRYKTDDERRNARLLTYKRANYKRRNENKEI